MIGESPAATLPNAPPAALPRPLLAVQNGASLVRVHDVRETVDALKVWMELR
jgi:dihydropteroate synthase